MSAIKVLAWNAAILLVALLGLELVFGGWTEAVTNSQLWRLSIYRDVDWRLPAQDKYGRTEPVVYKRDAFGLRGAYGKTAEIDMLVVGGSTTDERFVTEGETWVDLTQSCLRQNGANITMANGGVPGQSSRGHLRNFQYWYPFIPDLKPRWILVYLGINENALSEREAEDDVRTYNESHNAAWIERIKMKSALYALATIARGNYLAWRAGLQSVDHPDQITSTQYWDQRLNQPDLATLAVGGQAERDALRSLGQQRAGDLAAYELRLRDLAKAITDFGAHPIFVTQAGGGYRRQGGGVVGNVEQYLQLTLFNRATLKACAQLGIPCLDLADLVSFGPGDFYDPVHTTPSGSRQIAQIMCSGLSPLLKGKTP